MNQAELLKKNRGLDDFTYDEEKKLIVGNTIDVFLEERGVGYMVLKKLKEHSGKGKFVQMDWATGERQSFDELLRKSVRVAMQLRTIGIKPGDIVATYCINEMEPGVILVASCLIGAVFAAFDVGLPEIDKVDMFKEILPKILFTTTGKPSGVDVKVISFDSTEYKEDFLGAKVDEDDFKAHECKSLDEICALKFSSGTTGTAKGIQWSHRYILYHCLIKGDHIKNYFIQTSLYWIISHLLLIGAIHKGICKSLIADPHYYKYLWELIEKYNVDKVMLGPYKSKGFVENIPEGHVSKLKVLFLAGSYCSKELIEYVRSKLPNTFVNACYGLTETGILFNFLKREYFKYPESIGAPFPNTTYKVVDIDTEQAVGFNQKGELRVKSKNMCSGYYKRESSDLWDSEGFLRTGDVVTYNESFCFYYADRIKEMFRYKEYNLEPVKYEQILDEHPDVIQCVIIGVPHENDTSHVALVVVKKEGSAVTEADIEQYYNSKVDDVGRIRAGVHFVAEIPRTVTGKIIRRKIKEEIVKKLQRQ